MTYEEDVTAFRHELDFTLETIEEGEGQVLGFEAEKLIKDRDAAMQLKGKRAVLSELLELAGAFVLGNEPPYEKAWDMLNDKYAENAPSEKCEGCGNPVIRHETAARASIPGSVRHSIREDGVVCCSHLPPKA
jgi:hypothetical protein